MEKRWHLLDHRRLPNRADFVRKFGVHPWKHDGGTIASSDDKDVLHQLERDLNAGLGDGTYIGSLLVDEETEDGEVTVNLEIWKTPSGGIVALESCFLEQVSQVIPDPYGLGWFDCNRGIEEE